MAASAAGVVSIAILVALLIASAIGAVALTVQRALVAIISLLMLRAAQAAGRHGHFALETAAAAGSVISAVLAFII